MVDELKVDRPTLIISLDVELGWGFIENKQNSSFLIKDDKAGRAMVEYLLDIFEKYDIAATWAVVGHLFMDHYEMEDDIPHKDMRRCKENWYSRDSCTNLRKGPLYYGKDIVEKIILSPIEHEIGYHSFSHYDFSKCGREVAEAEIKKGLKLANEFGIKLESFVFPYDKIGYLDILKKYGFKIYRGRGLVRWDIDQSRLVQKINGVLDQIVPPLPVEPQWTDGLWEIPSSMVFSGFMMLAKLLASRGKLGIERAIRSNKVFHVTLHPWNLLLNPLIAKELEKLLIFASQKRDDGRLHLTTMGELASYLNKKHRIS